MKKNEITIQENEINLPEISTDLKSAWNRFSDSQKKNLLNQTYERIYSNQLERLIMIQGIDYSEKKETFLNDYEKKSKSTYRTYKQTFELLEDFCRKEGIENCLYFDYSTADNFIRFLKERYSEASSIRLHSSVASSFFSFLERETNNRIYNAFRGSKQNPKKKDNSKLNQEEFFPSDSDVQTIIEALPDPIMKGIAKIVSLRGFRAGAFQNMKIDKKNMQFYARSKNKDISGILPASCLAIIEDLGLSLKEPFREYSANRIECYFRYYTRKLYSNGEIKKPYSIHSLRHYFAVKLYESTHDIYKVSILLNHASVEVTQIYLKGLSVELEAPED